MIGTTVSHYRITARLGEGGMGVVYRARDERLDRDVAIKFLPPSIAQNRQARVRFMREARAASALEHPNICTVFEIDETDDGSSFMVMPCYEGETLRERLDRGAMSVEETLQLAEQLASALDAAHEQGIVHRDVKPQNVILTHGGRRAILMDFGLAHSTEATQITKTGTLLGTVAYMSPEQARGESVHQQSDLWSLGVILYEALAGTRPFAGSHEAATLLSIQQTDPPPLTTLRPETPPFLEDAVERLLEKDPRRRTPNAAELQETLASSRTPGPPATTLGLSRTLRNLQRARRQRPRLILGLVGLVIVLGAMATWRLLTPPADRTRPSVAILPLADLGGDPDPGYFVAGLHEELISTLSRVPGLDVISRASTLRYANLDTTLSAVAEELGVTSIVEGSVQRSGDGVRISVQLVDPASGRNKWSRSFETDGPDLLGIQGEIARALAGAIRGDDSDDLDWDEPRRVDPRAQELYLRGRYFLSQATRPASMKAIESFEEATAVDPEFARAHASLATAIMLHGQMASLPPTEYAARAKEAALRALELDEDLGEAHGGLAVILAEHEYAWAAAEREYERALQLDPSLAMIRVTYAQTLGYLGRHEESYAQARRAAELDPFNPFVALNSIVRPYFARNFDRVLAEMPRVEEMFPESYLYHWMRAVVLAGKEQYAEALVASRRAIELSDSLEPLPQLGWICARAGFRSEAEQILSRFDTAEQDGYVPAYYRAIVYTGLGEIDTAIDWLERSYEGHEYGASWVGVEPMYDPLRGHPRFQALLEKLDLVEVSAAAVG